MKKLAFIGVVTAVAVIAFLLGVRLGPRTSPGVEAGPTAAGQPADSGGVATPGAEDAIPGSVTIDSRKRQLIGIRVGAVEKRATSYLLRVLGRIAADETRLYIINAATTGWVMHIEPATPGTLVRKDQVLASFYAPELLGAQQAFLYGLNARDAVMQRGDFAKGQVDSTEISIAQYRDQLTNLGMGPKQIEWMAKTRERVNQVDMCSPTTGVILSRNIFPGLKFVQGQEFFRIADLSRVWILADVFEGEDKYLRPGLKAEVTLRGREKTFQAQVSRLLPLFDPEARTLKVRLEAGNPGYALRPDMFVDVALPVELPPAVVVPADAVLDSGLKKTVFVEREEGLFEPRSVETGWRHGGEVEIVDGLEPGERIALSGTFLIDSESRMELAAAGTVTTLAQDPVSGAMVSIAKADKAGRKSVYNGKAYYFSSAEGKAEFDKNPQKFADQPEAEQPSQGNSALPPSPASQTKKR